MNDGWEVGCAAKLWVLILPRLKTIELLAQVAQPDRGLALKHSETRSYGAHRPGHEAIERSGGSIRADLFTFE